MSNSNLTDYPHIYKKNKILKLKPLSLKGFDNRIYFFQSTKGGVPSVINHCNNLNEIMGRCLLILYSLSSFFGISKDPSEKLSKNPSNWNKAKSLFRDGEGKDNKTNELQNSMEKILKILDNQSKEIKNIKDSLKPTSIGEENVLKKLDSLESYLKKLLGEA